ncbi:2-C-methyl-D-erythritol 4-phosphate cytidylyltransferase [Dyadobacter psychrotolerans]|uniref:2-C-methyl-D-erythritol 4-phosphate cytidylyltransferase n=1 Tax=Dyadobacter psychrotolerans TaxID=2541721 RepID=A0A4R5DFI3_9BACT|nr:2-C-methyl-D-erythritol 4-phosphate cytidylyltransferase [Dyadobacter psychrotolerans]TDE12722.1 2-C-methyl-D-erythritol 4-phosphate cytidylyltransferase [Dyadobacter psychrotolerans]
MQEYVIIVAGGSGSRMKSNIPKQFIAVNGLPILMHTINAFKSYSSNIFINVVLPKEQLTSWKELCMEYGFETDHQLVVGGETRFDSVKNGLGHISGEEGLVAVHDGVRPVISTEIIKNSFTTALISGTAVTAVAMKDSLRQISAEGKNTALDRSSYRLVQTPQTFRLDWMRTAFSQSYQPTFTDCASVLESAGYSIHLIEGAYENIKITTPEDLRWAEIYLIKNT